MVSGRDVCTTSAPWLEDSAPAFFLRLALLIAGQREDDLTAADTPTQTGPGNARPLEYACMYAFI